MKTKLLIIIFINSFIFLAFIGCKENIVIFPATKDAEEKELKALLNDIQAMADQISCDNPADWRIVPIGSKSCNGATNFIVYSAKINTSLFLQEVERYNQMQKAFNIKWQLISDCTIIMAPKSIECINGKPKLIY
ncbi:hypothetical protein [Pedobacter rhodius]|uniref:Lipoprotein n=1 Tax=Pedobacter rhodius TaxID=3004098 RepID=A0ABT4L1Z4_9SPHI|nr:hypothetical protein [Pedobacter sp. SJ11]MCZ4225216.1 hypothetical protein [Pedobacter sp. SJ11]